MMKKVKISIEGRVQGVGFRYTTKQLADHHQVKGTVRNEEDGSVSIEAVGTDEAVDAFIEKLQNNPAPFSRVEKVTVTEAPSLANFISFKITN